MVVERIFLHLWMGVPFGVLFGLLRVHVQINVSKNRSHSPTSTTKKSRPILPPWTSAGRHIRAAARVEAIDVV